MCWGEKLCCFDKAKRQDKPVHGKSMACSNIYANDNVFIKNVIHDRSQPNDKS